MKQSTIPLAFICVICFALFVVSFGNQSFAQKESIRSRDNAATEIVESRWREAVRNYWSDVTGFSMAPMELEKKVADRASERIKQLENNNPSIWKTVRPAFAQRYAQRQKPINDANLQKNDELRRLINEGIETAVQARGGGSASSMLFGFAEAETEWILRQLSNGKEPSISRKSFAKRLRSSVLYDYTEDASVPPVVEKTFSKSLEMFQKAELLLTPERQFVLREEVSRYFGD